MESKSSLQGVINQITKYTEYTEYSKFKRRGTVCFYNIEENPELAFVLKKIIELNRVSVQFLQIKDQKIK